MHLQPFKASTAGALRCSFSAGVVAVLSLLLQSSAFAQTEESDKSKQQVEGWKTARWGMTEEQLLQSFKGEAKRLEREEKFQRDGDTGVATIGIERIEIANKPFHVRFILDSGNRKLKQVLITAHESERFPEMMYPELERLFTEKYGKPDFSSNEQDRTSEKRLRSWKRDRTRIQLDYSELKSLNFKLLVIVYEALPLTGKDNI